MTNTNTTPAAQTAADVEAALDELRGAIETRDALAPLRRLLADVDEAIRAAALKCRDAGLSERAVATRAEVAQPTLREWLDGRRGAPVPPPALHTQLWAYHQIAAALVTLTLRARSHPDMPDRAPSTRHADPDSMISSAYKELAQATDMLGRTAAAAECHQQSR
jgi:hypothetical protein